MRWLRVSSTCSCVAWVDQGTKYHTPVLGRIIYVLRCWRRIGNAWNGLVQRTARNFLTLQYVFGFSTVSLHSRSREYRYVRHLNKNNHDAFVSPFYICVVEWQVACFYTVALFLCCWFVISHPKSEQCRKAIRYQTPLMKVKPKPANVGNVANGRWIHITLLNDHCILILGLDSSGVRLSQPLSYRYTRLHGREIIKALSRPCSICLVDVPSRVLVNINSL